MAKKKSAPVVSEKLDRAIDSLLDNIDTYEELEDKLAIIDRAIKRDLLRTKGADDESGSALFGEDEDDAT